MIQTSHAAIRNFLAGFLCLVALVHAQKPIKPGWNLFTAEQDVQIGKESSQQIEKEVEVVNDRRLTNYVAGIGKRLADVAPGAKYPYSFKVVADKGINAFALPGGPIYVNTGLITAADNEAQLAGVLAHEVSHVALRHGTNRASKAQIFQLPLLLAGETLGSKGGLVPALAQLGIGFGVNSVFMKYSRDAEKQSDRLGARMLAQVGYDPLEMARFFSKLAESGGGRAPAFFSSHPNPENRVELVEEELEYLPSREYTKGSRQFDSMKQRAAKVEPSKKLPARGEAGRGERPGASQEGFANYRGSGYEFAYPSGWGVREVNQGAAVTIAPQGGVVRLPNGVPGLATGLMAGFFEPERSGLRSGTDELVRDLQGSNPDLLPLRGQRKTISIGGQKGENVLLEGPSPIHKQREFVWLVTAERPEGLFYLVLVSPDETYNQLRPRYQKIIRSIRFP